MIIPNQENLKKAFEECNKLTIFETLKNSTKMKQTTLYLTLLTFLFASCTSNPSKKVNAENVAKANQTVEASSDMPVMTFDKTDHDFGTIKEGDTVETVFTFTNTGGSDLIITNAKGSCGCTVPDYPKNTPIKPGDSGEIKVKFDSSNKPNLQSKTVTISANTQNARELIRIKTFVTPDPIKQQQRDERMKARQQAMQPN